MANCTGYGFDDSYTFCTSGPVGNGETADLMININSSSGSNFASDSSITVNDWDGSEVEVDIFSLRKNPMNQTNGYLSYGANCPMTAATLTISPDAGTNGGTATLEITLDTCNSDSNNGNTTGFDNCGGEGPHVISEMSTFTLSEAVCAS